MDQQVQELSTRARDAVQLQDWATVHDCASKLLDERSDLSEGHFLMGLAEKAARRPLKAAAAFEKAIELDPIRYDAAVELASIYSIGRRNGEAAALLDRYLHLLDNSPRYLDMAGTVYVDIGLAERALPLYRRANELQADIDLFQSNLAACNVYLGKVAEASEIYRKLLDRNPAHQRNHYQFSRLQKATDAKHAEEMARIERSTNLPPDQNVFLYYAIGKELEDLERWDDAFRYYRKAGDAVASVANYDVATDERLIDTIISTCNSEWLQNGAAGPDPRSQPKTPILITGLPRTGTTLTERIISSHSQVETLGETQFLQMVIRRESAVHSVEKMTPEMVSGAAAADISKIRDGYLDAVAYRLGDAPLFIDKLPFNFLFLGFAAKAWPDARLVVLRRHPLDSCFAMYKQVFTWAYKFSYTLEQLGRYYIAHERLYHHWQDVLGDRLITVRYEQLVSDQEAQTRRLLDQLQLEFEPACLAFDKNPAASATASSVQVREKIHTRSVARWKNFEKHLQPLRRQLEAAGIDVP